MIASNGSDEGFCEEFKADFFLCLAFVIELIFMVKSVKSRFSSMEALLRPHRFSLLGCRYAQFNVKAFYFVCLLHFFMHLTCLVSFDDSNFHAFDSFKTIFVIASTK